MKKLILIALLVAFAPITAHAQAFNSFTNTNALAPTDEFQIYSPSSPAINGTKMRNFLPSKLMTDSTNLVDPNVNAALFWNDVAGNYTFLNFGTGLSVSGNTLNATGTGTVSSVSVVSANGFAGSVATATTTPSITITTSITGLVKGNGTAISAATAGTDYVAPGTATSYTAQQNFGVQALTDGASIAWNLNTQQVASVTLGGNRALANPTNQVAGGTYILTITQDGTGSRTLSYGANYKWPGGVAPILSTGAAAVDILTCVSNGTNMNCVMQKDFK